MKRSIFLMSFLRGSDSKESACNAGDLGLIPESGRSPAEGNGNPLHYLWLENSMDRRAPVHGVTKSQTQLTLHFQVLRVKHIMTTLKTFVSFLYLYPSSGWVSWVMRPHLIPGPSVSSTGLGCELNKPVRWLRLYTVSFLTRLIPLKSMMGEFLKSSGTCQKSQRGLYASPFRY